MTSNVNTVPADPTVGGHHHHGTRVVAALAITSTVGYGTLYCAYAFSWLR
ncbi:hypothetical protein ACIBTV_30970 [Micromonospora sp. NPDC049366]